uniref:Uncharacterized protein n=1 Tax=Rhizophora mucronata TaxID=61149 RepID=A0A2P2K0H2_RHIMU
MEMIKIIEQDTGLRTTMDVLAPWLARSSAISMPELPDPTTRTFLSR